jgi:hypothetical protein
VGGGEKFDADGVAGDSILEAKFCGDLKGSPYIKGSECPEWLYQRILHEQKNEFRRMAAIINCNETPLKNVEIILNTPLSAPYFSDLLKEFGINGRLVIRP